MDDTRDLAESLTWAACVLDAKRSACGNAFMVSGRQALTCAHVINVALGRPADSVDPPRDARVQLYFPLLDKSYWAAVSEELWLPRAVDHSGDVAAVTIRQPPHEVMPVPLGALPRGLGTRVSLQAWFGGPDEYHSEHATARSIGRLGLRMPQVLLKHDEPDYPIFRGFSGAPVWDYASESYVGGMIVSIDERRGRARGAAMMPIGQIAAEWPELELQISLTPRSPRKRLRKESERVAYRIAAEVQWPDKRVRRIDRLEQDDRPWVVSLFNWSGVPVTKVVATVANDRDALTIHFPTLQPRKRQWYILRAPEVNFDSENEDPPGIGVEFSALGIGWHLEDGELSLQDP